jgi:protein gp37
MAEHSAIEWTDHTFNPWEGCQKVGPGCDNCYAETRNERFAGGIHWGPGAPRRRTSPSNWARPLRWQANATAFLAEHGRRQRVFCASLADVFDNAVSAAWRSDLFQLIERTPDLDWLLLTKRIGNVAGMVDVEWGTEDWPPNVWLGATIVSQAEADRDVPKLLAIKGPRFRFLSMEPLLGPVDLNHVACVPEPHGEPDWTFDALTTGSVYEYYDGEFWMDGDGAQRDVAIDWIIVGGESGPGARPLHFTWVQSLRDQCASAGVPFLFKQWGEWAPICSMSEELIDSLYHPAPARDPEASRRCKVEQLVMHKDGKIFSLSRKSAQIAVGSRLMFQQGYDGMTMFAVGKTRAGRLLDGLTYDGVPA